MTQRSSRQRHTVTWICTRPSLSVSCCSLSSHSFSLLLLSSAWAVCCLCRDASSCRCFSKLRCFSCSISELGREPVRDKDEQEEERSLRACRCSSMKLSCWTTTAWANSHGQQTNSSHRHLLKLHFRSSDDKWSTSKTGMSISSPRGSYTAGISILPFRTRDVRWKLHLPDWTRKGSNCHLFQVRRKTRCDCGPRGLDLSTPCLVYQHTCRVLRRKCRFETLLRTCCRRRHTDLWASCQSQL